MTDYLDPKTNRNKKTITWTSDFSTEGKQRACDIINIGDNPGTLLGAARNIDTIEDALNLLFDDQTLDLLVRETNDFIERKPQTLKSFKEHFSKFQNILILVKLFRWKCVPLLVSCIYMVCMDIKLIFFSATKQVLQSLVQFSPETE